MRLPPGPKVLIESLTGIALTGRVRVRFLQARQHRCPEFFKFAHVVPRPRTGTSTFQYRHGLHTVTRICRQ